MYSLLDKDDVVSKSSEIVKAFVSDPTTGKELTSFLSKAASAAYKEDIRRETSLLELRRQFHCAAYNCLIVIISRTQTEQKFYSGLLFSDNVAKGWFVFENLIDLKKVYQFESELTVSFARKKTLQLIRTSGNTKNTPTAAKNDKGFVAYISSQYLMGSSLSQDVNQFDFNDPIEAYASYANTSTADDSQSNSHDDSHDSVSDTLVTEEETLIELDDMNQHECMSIMLSLIKHMKRKNVYSSPPDGTEAKELPTWMAFLCNKMSTKETGINIKLFISKLIINEPKIFEPFGQFWFSSLVDFILSGKITGPSLNYLILDLTVVMLSWSPTVIPEDSVCGRNLASSLLDYLLKYSHHTNKSFLKNNLQIIKTMTLVWSERLEISYEIIHEHFKGSDPNTKNNLTGIQLLGVVLSNGFQPYKRQTTCLTENDFFEDLTQNLNYKYKDVFASCAEVCSLALKYYRDNNKSLGVLFDMVKRYLLQFSKTLKECFVLCIHRMQFNFPEIVDSFVPQLLYCLVGLYGILKTQCIQCLAARIDHLQHEHVNIYQQVKGKELDGMITHKEEETQRASVQFVQGLLKSLSVDQTVTLLPKIACLQMSSSVTLREVMYGLFMWVYDKYKGDMQMESEAGLNILRISKEVLLVGINDSDTNLSLKVLNFWRDESRLPNSTIERLIEILRALYSSKTEKEYLSYSTNLMLQLTSLSPDYSRPLFDTGLDSEESFHNYHVNFSWQRQDVAMTPLFVATQQSTQGTYNLTQESSLGVGMLGETQKSFEFTQTNEMSSMNWMNPSVQITSHSFNASPSTLQSSSFQSPLFSSSSTNKKDNSSYDETDASNLTVISKTNEILRLKRKFLKDQKSRNVQFASMEIKRQKLRVASLERQKASRDRKVVMYRKYRVGKLPDIQIKHSELIVPLQALAQLDSTLGRQLFCAIFSSVFTELPKTLLEDVLQKVNVDIQDAIDVIMKSTTINNSAFTYAIENICYVNKEFKLEPHIVSNVSIISLQQPVGILLLEKQLLTNIDMQLERKRKRMKGITEKAEDVRTWLELAKMYDSIDNYDWLRSIFTSQISKADDTKNALMSEARNDFETALSLYREASRKEYWENSPTEEEEEYWDTARLRCYENLGLWTNLNNFILQSIVQIIDDGKPVDVMKIWDDEVLQETYLPCYMKSNIKLLCQGKLKDVHEGFSNFIEQSLKEEEAKEHLQARYCDELALLNIFQDNYGGAQHFLNIAIQSFLDEWSHMSRLISASRQVKLQRLQKVNEMNQFISLMLSEDCQNESKVRELLCTWNSCLPDNKIHSTLVWDDVILNRCSFIRKIKSNFHANDDFVRYLAIEETKNVLQVAEVARKQGNYAVANEYLRESSEKVFKSVPEDCNLSLQWRHIYAKIHCDKVKIYQRDVKTDMQALVSVISHLDKCKGYIKNDTYQNVEQCILEYQTWKCMNACLKRCDFDQANNLISDLKNVSSMSDVPVNKEECMKSINEHSMSLLNIAISASDKLIKGGPDERRLQVKALMKMVVFCDDLIKEEAGNEKNCHYAELIVQNLLKAMKLGSDKARLRFPRLLQLIELFPEICEVFEKQSIDVPSWMFLSWINQIVALIDKPVQASILPLLNNIAKSYPQALMYPLRVSNEQYVFTTDSDGLKRKKNFEKLLELVSSPLLELFADALGQLTNPTHVYKDLIAELQKCVQNREPKKVDACWKELQRRLFDVGAQQYGQQSRNTGGGIGSLEKGSFIKDFAKQYGKAFESAFGKNGKKLHGMSIKEFNAITKTLDVNNKKKYIGNLKEFSPWLSNFQASHFHHQLEIPGQYNGCCKPMTDYHVKISSFDPRVQTMNSMRQPKQLIIRGGDEKEYKFLVKGGEDLRLDQRIEQIFELMNVILQNDSICSNRLLNIKTYQVVSITPRVGIIEWVDDTVPYENLVIGTMSDKEKTQYNSKHGPAAKHNDFIMKYRGDYSEMYKKANRSETEKLFKEKEGLVPWDLLRRAFAKLAASSEAYFILRSHFIQSHACMCVAHYILGIGDRHLSNTLIDKTTGGVIGIDFGHAFGTATQLIPVPELIPFRLTKQMLNLLLPIQDASPYKLSMIAVLQAFRKHSSLLLNTMDVFIKEPLLDWEGHAKRQKNVMMSKEETSSPTWYPQLKIDICRQKLSGINPAYITGEELRVGQWKNSAVKDFIAIAKGTPAYNIRARFLEKSKKPEEYSLTVDEQVDCLVEQATDPNILGRTWVGWMPWV